jgi:tetratricopeptide (TPR) repeat protein
MKRSIGLSGALAVGGVVLLLNSAVLAVAPSASLWYIGNVVLHPLLGLGLTGAALWWCRRQGWPTGVLARLAVVVTAGGVASGMAVVGAAAVGALVLHRSPVLLDVHVWLSVLGAALVGLWVWRGVGSGDGPARDPGWLSPVTIRAAVLLLAAVAVAVPSARTSWDTRWRQTHALENPSGPPATMDDEGAGVGTPLFPSSAQTSTGDLIPSDFFLTSETCARCHRDIYDQWNGSAHHFSSFNNQWYRRSIEYMQEVVGTESSKWCAGCHDHALFFNGRFDQPVVEQIDTPEAQAGLGCTSCHAVTHVGSTMGQGDFVMEYPPLHDLAASDNPVMRGAHDLITRLAPEPHRRTFMKPFHDEQGAEFCSTCHKVHLDVPVNGYRWIRGFNEYDNWQGSGVSGQGARSFYYPETPQTCASCHMPLVASDDPAADNGFVRSHRFPGANTALPHVNNDPVQLAAVQNFLRAGQVSVDVFGVARVDERPASATRGARAAAPRLSSTFAVGEESGQFGASPVITGPPPEVVGPLGVTTVAVRRGDSVRVEVVVRTRNVGHFFPGGTVDAPDVWVEFEAVDETGRVLLHSGAAADDGRGPVDPGAHVYRSLQLDAHGNPINKRNSWMTRSVAYVRLIPPGAADTVHYRLRVPEDAGDRITLRAKLNYRKFAWWYTQWAFAGERAESDSAPAVGPAYDDGEWTFTGDTSDVSGEIKAIPDIPTTVMAESEATLEVIDADAILPEVAMPSDPSTRGRWNDYGIGLLLQGDVRGAEAAFRRVMAIDPDYPDGPVNVARAKIREGDVDAAIPLLEQALALSPGLARAHFFLGTSLRTLGLYDEALTHLEAARQQYPRDRVVLNEIGGIQFRQRRFDDAVRTSEEVLQIDPEDMQAHYNLMLSHQGAGRSDDAARERALYERFKADESAQVITGDFRRASPEDNNERQPTHEHRASDRAVASEGTP